MWQVLFIYNSGTELRTKSQEPGIKIEMTNTEYQLSNYEVNFSIQYSVFNISPILIPLSWFLVLDS